MNAGRSDRNPPVEFATTLGPEIDKLLADWRLRMRRTQAAQRAWESVASGDLAKRCSAFVARNLVVVECDDGAAFVLAMRLRNAMLSAVNREIRGDSITKVFIKRRFACAR